MKTNRLFSFPVFATAIPSKAFSNADAAEVFREILSDFSSSSLGNSRLETALEQLPQQIDSVTILEVRLVSCPRELFEGIATEESWQTLLSTTKV